MHGKRPRLRFFHVPCFARFSRGLRFHVMDLLSYKSTRVQLTKLIEEIFCIIFNDSDFSFV